MDFCKLFVIASIVFFGGVFGQLRFQRHLDNATTTQNGLEQGFAEVNGLSHDNELVSDDDGNNVVLDKPETVDVELLTSNGQLELQMCPYKCIGTKVSACYDSLQEEAKGVCGPNQCEFTAGVYTKSTGKDYVWFMVNSTYEEFTGSQCPYARMKYDTVKFYGLNGPSCDPVKRDGKIVTLHVRHATKECSIKVINAKRWFPTTTAPPTTAPPPSLSSPAQG